MECIALVPPSRELHQCNAHLWECLFFVIGFSIWLLAASVFLLPDGQTCEYWHMLDPFSSPPWQLPSKNEPNSVIWTCVYLHACLMPFFCMLLEWDCSRIFLDFCMWDSMSALMMSCRIIPSIHIVVSWSQKIHMLSSYNPPTNPWGWQHRQ